MDQPINYILTSEEYFDIINFDSKGPKEKVAYLLYYVTQVARLRKDMVPRIIADRIHDQYRMYLLRIGNTSDGQTFQPLSPEDVATILKDTTDYFEPVCDGIIDYRDRNPNDIAYVLSKQKLSELNDEFNKSIRDKLNKSNQKSFFEGLMYFIIIVACFIASAVSFLAIRHDDSGFDNVSIEHYADIMQFQSCNDLQKGVYFIYYITELTKLKSSVSPEVICMRLNDLGYIISLENMNSLLDNSQMVTIANEESHTYKLTQDGITSIDNTMISNIRKNSVFEIDKELAWTLIGVVLTGIGILLRFAFGLGKVLKK